MGNSFSRYNSGGYGYRIPTVDNSVVSVTGTTEPVTLAEAKNYLRINNTQDDDLITGLITNARTDAERYLNSDILAKQRRTHLTFYEDPINLYYAPIATVDSVTVEGQTLTVDDEYTVDGLNNPLVCLMNTAAEDVQITYTTAGITTLAEVPNDSIKWGVLALLAWKYYHRGAEEKGIMTNWKSWLSPYKQFGYYGQR